MTKFTVNDRPVWYRMDPDTPLLWALRDASNLTGTKYGCGTGDCGACMVEVDGEAIRSCLVTIAEMEGRFVTTIEALSRDRSHPVQQAWAAENVPQCGFCQSGMIMAAAVLLKKKPNRHIPAHPRGDPACRAGGARRSRAQRRAATGDRSGRCGQGGSGADAREIAVPRPAPGHMAAKNRISP